MRQDASAGWMKFSARQTSSATACEFDWRASMGPAGVIRVRDSYINGAGHLSARALGLITIVKSSPSPELDRGELMRYLAELAWTPDAILFNASLGWREDSRQRLIVSAGEGVGRAEVTLSLDSEGRIGSASAAMRPRSEKSGFKQMPWGGVFSDYRRHQGRWLPFAAEVGWPAPGGEIVWQGRIESWDVV